jgi:hypothetical protein
MMFPGGESRLPDELVCSGRTGINGPQVKPAERLPALDVIPTRRLEQLHDELGALACLEPEGALRDYMTVIELQCAAELVRRMNRG